MLMLTTMELYIFRYLREYAVLFRDFYLFLCMDDKHIHQWSFHVVQRVDFIFSVRVVLLAASHVSPFQLSLHP